MTTGVRFTKEDRQTTSSTGIKDNGSAPELNPDVVNNVSLGWIHLQCRDRCVLDPATRPRSCALADLVALQVFRRRGDRHAGRRVQQPHRAAARAGGRREGHPPRADRRGVPDDARRKASKRRSRRWVVSPSWKISEQLSTYVSWQHGEKAGISQFVNGVSNVVEAEKTEAYEIGLKTVLLNDTLVFNTAVFYSEIEDYQQQVRIVDEYTTEPEPRRGHSAGPGDGYTPAPPATCRW